MTIELAQSIKKDEINELPIERFEGRIFEIDQKAKVKAAVEYLKNYGAIGFDTETRPSFKKACHTKWRCCSYPPTTHASCSDSTR